jgi:hypothetical protein
MLVYFGNILLESFLVELFEFRSIGRHMILVRWDKYNVRKRLGYLLTLARFQPVLCRFGHFIQGYGQNGANMSLRIGVSDAAIKKIYDDPRGIKSPVLNVMGGTPAPTGNDSTSLRRLTFDISFSRRH